MTLTVRPDDWRRRRLANDYETPSNYTARVTYEATQARRQRRLWRRAASGAAASRTPSGGRVIRASEQCSLTVASSSIHCAQTVRNLGVTFDSKLSMKSHISKIGRACFFHLRRLRQLRGVVTDEAMKQLVTSLVLSRLDYCNSYCLDFQRLFWHLYSVYRTWPLGSFSNWITR